MTLRSLEFDLVMNCDQNIMSATVYAWIMVRKQSYTSTTKYEKLRNRLAETYDLLVEDFIENDYENGLDCDYDFLEYY